MSGAPPSPVVAPRCIIVLGVEDSGAEAIGLLLSGIGLSRIDVTALSTSAPRRPLSWVHDAELTFGQLRPLPPGAMLLFAARDDAEVSVALARRFAVAADVGLATWRNHRRHAERLLLDHPHIVIELHDLVANPAIAACTLVDQLRAAGVPIAAGWTNVLDDMHAAVRRLGTSATEHSSLPAPTSPPRASVSRPAIARLDALEQRVATHDAALVQSSRTISSLRRKLAAQRLAASAGHGETMLPPRPSPAPSPSDVVGELHATALTHAVEVFAGVTARLREAQTERDGLIEIIDAFRRDAVALLHSRRWRVGDRIGSAVGSAIGRRGHELAADRMSNLLERLQTLQLISLEPEPPAAMVLPAAATELLDRVEAATVESTPAPLAADTHAAGDGGWQVPAPRGYAVIVLANVGWDSRQQRPHHLARAFAAHGHPVFYGSIGVGHLGEERVVDHGVVEVELRTDARHDRYTDVAGAAVVAEWMVAMEALSMRHGIDDAVVHVHLQSWTPLAWQLRDAFGWRVVYDCMDEWEGFPGMGPALLDAERELVGGADLVVTTAERLRQKWAPHNPNTVLVRNGVDADFFARTCLPSDLLADAGHPIIGFTGGLAPWVHFELIASVARARPDWTFVLVGDVFVEVGDLHGLERMDNVIMTGLQPYTSMPRYLFWFDVAMIPFVVDHISAAVDPVKFYEYAASGTPIVATPLPELAEHRELFHEGADAASFEAAVEAALQADDSHRDARIALARANTWSDRYETFHRATTALWQTVSVVIVTFGQLPLTRRCLDSLIADTSHPAFEIIVVDNGSVDGTPNYLQWIATQDSRIRVILNPDNRGFAAANNQGLAIATGDVLILLNNDTEVSPGWHVPILGHLADPSIGLVGPRSDNVGNAARIDVPGSSPEELAAFARRLREEHEGELFEIRMLGMFCVAMRREVYAAVGPLDEAYGIGLFEDDDYAERVRDAGWRIVCARDAFVHHVGQASFRHLIADGEYDRLWRANRATFEARWGPWTAQTAGATSHGSRSTNGSDTGAANN